jgi:hypothetical protein
MRERIILFLILGFDAIILLYSVSTLSITSHEADVYFNAHTFVNYITHISTVAFGENDYALRLPMILFHLLSVVMLYLVSKPYVKRNTDRLWLIFVYVLLPGVMSAALLVNSAGIMIFTLFLLLYLYQIKSKFIPLFLILFLFIDSAYAILYFALFIYAFNKNNRYYMALTLLLFISNYFYYGVDAMGKPSGHFLDTLGLYATIFSPVVFLFMIYVLYRNMVTKKDDITLYVGGIVFVVSLLLSFRQSIHIEHFAPYLMLLLPLSAQTFFSSYRVRLRMFRGGYRAMVMFGFVLLIIHFFLLLFNKGLYLFLEDPHDNFAYKTHIVKELAGELHKQKITCVMAENENLQLRLKFYGITECSQSVLYEVPKDIVSDVTIRYVGRKVAAFNVTKSPI